MLLTQLFDENVTYKDSPANHGDNPLRAISRALASSSPETKPGLAVDAKHVLPPKPNQPAGIVRTACGKTYPKVTDNGASPRSPEPDAAWIVIHAVRPGNVPGVPGLKRRIESLFPETRALNSRIHAKHLYKLRNFGQMSQGVTRRLIPPAMKVHKEHILPRTSAHWPRLDLAEIDISECEHA